MAFKLLLLWSFFLLGRPQDLLPVLQPLRPALLLTAMTLLAVVFSGGQKLSNAFSLKETKRFLFFIAIMVFGIPFAFHRRVAFESVFLGYLANILFFLFLISEVDSLKKLKSLILIISLSNFLFSFFGYFFGSSHGRRFGIYGSMFDENDIAYVLVSLFPLSLFYLLSNQGLLKKALGITVICSSIMVILMSGSRGGLLGLATVLAILLLTKSGGMKKSQKILTIGLMIGVYFVIKDRIDIERYLTLFEIGSDYNISDETGRTQIWEKAITLMLYHPITGVGVECFPMALGYMRESMGLQPIWQVTHNSFLQIGAEVGLIGFGLFIFINLQSLLTFLHNSRIEATSTEALEYSILSGLMFLGFTGHLVTAGFLSQGYSSYFILYFALAGIIQRLKMDCIPG